MPTIAPPARDVAERDRIADLILSLAVYGGREGTGVTDEDRDSAEYTDCQNAADAILNLVAAPPTAVPASLAREKVAAALRRQAEHEEDRARGALAVAVPAIDRDPAVQEYIDSKHRRQAYFAFVSEAVALGRAPSTLRGLPAPDVDAAAYVGALLFQVPEEV